MACLFEPNKVLADLINLINPEDLVGLRIKTL